MAFFSCGLISNCRHAILLAVICRGLYIISKGHSHFSFAIKKAKQMGVENPVKMCALTLPVTKATVYQQYNLLKRH